MLKWHAAGRKSAKSWKGFGYLLGKQVVSFAHLLQVLSQARVLAVLARLLG